MTLKNKCIACFDSIFVTLTIYANCFIARTAYSSTTFSGFRKVVLQNERFGLVIVKTGSINSGTGVIKNKKNLLVHA
jgi:hypothetical protein